MTVLKYQQFLKTLPTYIMPQLPESMQLTVRQPHRWLLQIHGQDRQIHYEVSRIKHRQDFELALHFESKNKPLNQHLLDGFSKQLIAIHAQLGESITAEPWDRGWAKVYEIFPSAPLTEQYAEQLGVRMATIISCLQPILLEIYDTPVGRKRVYSF